MSDDRHLLLLVPLLTVFVAGAVLIGVTALVLRRRLRGPRLSWALDLLDALYLLAVLLAFAGTLVLAARAPAP